MKDFFISYNKADRSWAEWIAWELEAVGYTTVIQAWDFRPGSNFVLEMQRAAEETDRTMPVLSPDYLAAEFTQPEWAAAMVADPRGERRSLVPVRVRDCSPKGLLRAVVYIDLVGLDEANAKTALLEGVRRERIKPSAEPRFPGAKPSFPGPSWKSPTPWRLLMIFSVILVMTLASLWVWLPRRTDNKPVPGPPPSDEYALIQPGEFLMGCSPNDPPCYEDETPHRVRMRNKFYMKKTEVTLREFREHAGTLQTPTDVSERPVTGVRWDQAKAYCESTGGRLPTEAEWEYAARAGTKTRFYGMLDEIAWYQGNTASSSPQKVGQKAPNSYGLNDMLGNAAEWVDDWYDGAYYRESPRTSPPGPSSGSEKVIRGGSFLDGPDSLRVSRRDRKPPSATAYHVGFRCVRDP